MRILTSAMIAATLIAVVAGCGGSSTPTPTPVRTAAPTPAPTAAPTAPIVPGGVSTNTTTSQANQGGTDVGGSFTLVIENGAVAGTYPGSTEHPGLTA